MVKRKTTSLKNAKGELLSVTDTMNKVVSYEYDPIGNLIKSVDPDGNEIRMNYDLRGTRFGRAILIWVFGVMSITLMS